ncbi:MAG: beta-glucuronidase [Spirochaetaceae bacterium]
MLYPRESETREIVNLCGIWKFKLDDEILNEEIVKKPLSQSINMAVPASYNDLTQNSSIRDHIGWVWYEREICISRYWKGRKKILHFGSVTHEAKVYINGKHVTSHKGGYLPFDVDISEYCNDSSEIRLSVAVSNILDWTTLPPGQILTYDDENHPKGFKTQEYFHDFFNYSGIHRPVKLCLIPESNISSISINADVQNDKGIVKYDITLSEKPEKTDIELLDRDGKPVVIDNSGTGTFEVLTPTLWEPGKAYLYTLKVHCVWKSGVEDIYSLPIGFRSIALKNGKFLINGKEFYFKGFGRHEDFTILGKGLNNALNVKDFSLLKWIGANSFRTSHYPYSEEMMNMADEEGIVIIDESPAVGLWNKTNPVFCEGRVGDEMLDHHLNVMEELINRDRHHPSVVMWSVVNEPASWEENSRPYFEKVASYTRSLDPSRPICAVLHSNPLKDNIGDLFDVIGFNTYPSWYTDSGSLEVINIQLTRNLQNWFKRYGKPVIVTEYGADTIAGLHQNPAEMFTEEYQWRMIDECQKVFDQHDFVIGEHLWNFADFATKQGVRRPGGNRKGIFTRNREPKLSAHFLRRRWTGKEL